MCFADRRLEYSTQHENRERTEEKTLFTPFEGLETFIWVRFAGKIDS